MKVPSFLLKNLTIDELKETYQWLRDSRMVSPSKGHPDIQLEKAIYDVLDIDLSAQEKYPRFSRQCSHCKFLGNYRGASLYYCKDKKYRGTYVEESYNSLMPREKTESDEYYIEAERRAKERGFIK